MSSLTNVITAEQLRANQDSVFEDVLTSAQPKVVIFEGEPSIMLVSTSDYKAQMNRLAIVEKIIESQYEAGNQ